MCLCAGEMVVNDEPAYRISSPGEVRGLNLDQPMYVGGVPNLQNIPNETGFRTGFVGVYYNF